MQLKAAEALSTGDLVYIRYDRNNIQLLARWVMGEEAVGIATRPISLGETIEFIPERSTKDILVRGSHSPMSGEDIVIQVACDLRTEELVCLRQNGGQAMLDRWGFGDEAVGQAARDIRAQEFVKFCAGRSTDDIQVKPGKQ